MQIKRVQEAMQAIKNGEMIIIMDDENRENEGDIVYAGEFSSAEKVNFLVTQARGVLCVSLTDEIAKKLDFPLMVDKNSSNHETAFTVSVDAKNAKTGVSAFERDMTIKLICDDNSTPSDFARPGHIFPLIAKKGGVLERTGHTEASVDICKLAGLKPIGVICELLKQDGTAASNNDDFVLEFAKKHNIKILYVADLIYYKIQYEQLVHKIEEKKVSFCGVECEKITFRDHLDYKHIVYKFARNLVDSNDLLEDSQNLSNLRDLESLRDLQNIKFHTFNNTLKLLENGEFEVLLKSIEYLKKYGGYLICMHSNNATNSEFSKEFGIGAQILKHFNITDFTLLTTHTNREYIALAGFGLKIREKVLI